MRQFAMNRERELEIENEYCPICGKHPVFSGHTMKFKRSYIDGESCFICKKHPINDAGPRLKDLRFIQNYRNEKQLTHKWEYFYAGKYDAMPWWNLFKWFTTSV